MRWNFNADTDLFTRSSSSCLFLQPTWPHWLEQLAHTHTLQLQLSTLLCQCSSYLQHRFILCVPQDFWCTKQNHQYSRNTSSQLYLEVPTMTVIIYWFIPFEVLQWLSYNDLVCRVKGQIKDSSSLIEAVSHVIGLLDNLWIYKTEWCSFALRQC